MVAGSQLVHTELGLIPKDWQIAPLSSHLQYISYGFTNPMPSVDSGVYMITARDINYGRIQYTTARCTTQSAYDGLLTDKSRPRSGDLLLTKDGTLGRLALVGSEKLCINQSVAILRPNTTVVPRFLKTLLEAPIYQLRMIEDAGGSTIKHIYITIIDKMPIAVPPSLAEQEAIADALSDADAWIESLEQLIVKKRQIKQGAVQELLSGKRLPGFEGKWTFVPIEAIAEITTGGRNTQDQVEDGKYPFFVRSQKIERINSYTFDGEAVLTAGDGVGTGKVFHYVNGKFDAHQRVYRISNFKSHVNGYFFYLYFSSHFYERIMQMTAKSSVDSVRREMIANMLFPVTPSKDEQNQIATILFELDEEIAALESKLSKARHLKLAMMQELLTGRTRLVKPTTSSVSMQEAVHA